MKITRQKHAKKHLGFFRNNFGVREPYQILLDGTFCQAALRGRIQLREQLPRYLMGETQLCTTRCVLKELETLGKDLCGAKLIAQKCQVRNCPHFKNSVSGSECLLSMVEDGNPHHYFVATQVIPLLKPDTQNGLRQGPPIVSKKSLVKFVLHKEMLLADHRIYRGTEDRIKDKDAFSPRLNGTKGRLSAWFRRRFHRVGCGQQV
ncbi:PREDICTED: rRNA-processing protein UTP23 homolog [Lipotes vexillifer]|uniref:rRNA-processing protein UTP23 homolog n=1 Tax=Lipotes vexillifer TaxID=118797 RepID=A0A340WVU9_LIPVE|nr:PREDICTED: rRNA-processing protein UTP23 homolog [Lipotes vexillifer]